MYCRPPTYVHLHACHERHDYSTTFLVGMLSFESKRYILWTSLVSSWRVPDYHHYSTTTNTVDQIQKTVTIFSGSVELQGWNRIVFLSTRKQKEKNVEKNLVSYPK